MKLTFSRKALSETLARLRPAVPVRDIKPILKSVKLIPKETGIEFQATDLETGISVLMNGVEVSDPEPVCLPFEWLSNIADRAERDELSIETKDAAAIVTAGFGEWETQTDSPGDFPEIPSTEGEPTFTVDADSLAKAFKRVRPAIAKDDDKYVFKSLLLETSQGSIECTASERHILSTVKISAGCGKSAVAMIPPNGVSAILNLASDCVMKVYITNSAVFAETDQGRVFARQVEGRPMPWRTVFPKEKGKTSYSVLAKELQGVTSRVSLGSDKNAASAPDIVGMTLEYTGNGKVIASIGSQSKRGKEEFVAVDPQGPAAKVRLGYDFLLNFLKCVEGDELLTLNVIDEKRPVVVTSSVPDWKGIVFGQA